MFQNFSIPFNQSSLVGRELEHIFRTMTIGQIAGDQTYSKKCHELLEQVLGVKKALVTSSCTHALEMCALLLGIQPGDEVIVPSFTFVSTANAFALRGARIVFADIRPDTLNLDETRLEALISPRTKAIAVMHYAGVGCEMDAILDLAASYGIPVVEDNAHGLFGKYRGRWLGTFGCLATQSFHETKNITCGEGGALLVNDSGYVERAEIIREKGTDRSRFFRGQVDKYSWVDIGSSYVMSDVLAAFLYAQLEVWQNIQTQRRRIWDCYDSHLRGWAGERGIGCSVVPPYCEQAYHMYYLLLPSLEKRQALIAFLKSRGILSVFHYLPLHLSLMGQRMGARADACPVAAEKSDRLVRLPFYNSLTQAQQDQVIEAVLEFPGVRSTVLAPFVGAVA
ncbi:MAG TPA: dTDP-4-amino-4,6-dideoxygalactose transaminase [Candidatus Binatia bacterium]|jgi:dTDP-4-amino-4,6-dideoxygalactose transaminase|nr:dTDP-4-amino-4,6-dideoxygalactose transaminase [Candidatus Binatia bacterium]